MPLGRARRDGDRIAAEGERESRCDLTDARRIDALFRDCAREVDAMAQEASASAVTNAVVIIDLTATKIVDTKLIACLVAVLRRARRLGVRLELRASPSVREWLELCHLRDVM